MVDWCESTRLCNDTFIGCLNGTQVIRHHVGEITRAVFLYIIDIKKLNIQTVTLMEQDHNRNHFTAGHRKSPFARLFRRIFRQAVSLRGFLNFFAEFVDNVENFN